MRFPVWLLPLLGLAFAFPPHAAAQEQPEKIELGPVEVDDASGVDVLKPLLPRGPAQGVAPFAPKAPTIDPMLLPHHVMGPRQPTLTRPVPRQIAPSYLYSASRAARSVKDPLAAKVPTSVTSGVLSETDLQTFRDLTQRGGYFLNRGGSLRYYSPSGDREDYMNAMRLKRSNYDRMSPTRGERQSQRDPRSLRQREGRMYRNQALYR